MTTIITVDEPSAVRLLKECSIIIIAFIHSLIKYFTWIYVTAITLSLDATYTLSDSQSTVMALGSNILG